MTIRFRYIAQPGEGWGKPTVHAHVLMRDPLPVSQAACTLTYWCATPYQSVKQHARSRTDARPLTSRSSSMRMESSEDICLHRNCSMTTAACFKVATKFRSLYLIMLNGEICFAWLVYTLPWTSKVSCSFFYNGVATGFWTPEANRT